MNSTPTYIVLSACMSRIIWIIGGKRDAHCILSNNWLLCILSQYCEAALCYSSTAEHSCSCKLINRYIHMTGYITPPFYILINFAVIYFSVIRNLHTIRRCGETYGDFGSPSTLIYLPRNAERIFDKFIDGNV